MPNLIAFGGAAQADSGLQPPSGRPPTRLDRADPEAGSVSGAAYANAYFGFSLPLPPGWSQGLGGPPPSPLGYYVLTALEDKKRGGASMLVAAQDLFFSAKPLANAAEMAADFGDAIVAIPDMTIDNGPLGVEVGGQAFRRLDFHAGGLYRV